MLQRQSHGLKASAGMCAAGSTWPSSPTAPLSPPGSRKEHRLLLAAGPLGGAELLGTGDSRRKAGCRLAVEPPHRALGSRLCPPALCFQPAGCVLPDDFGSWHHTVLSDVVRRSFPFQYPSVLNKQIQPQANEASWVVGFCCCC